MPEDAKIDLWAYADTPIVEAVLGAVNRIGQRVPDGIQFPLGQPPQSEVIWISELMPNPSHLGSVGSSVCLMWDRASVWCDFASNPQIPFLGRASDLQNLGSSVCLMWLCFKPCEPKSHF